MRFGEWQSLVVGCTGNQYREKVTNDGLTDEITRAREQQGDDWQQRLDEQYEGRFYERLQEAWGNEWSTRLDIVLQGSTDGWLVEQIRNESYTLQVGNKRYELSNHLGNVLAVVSDKKEQSDGVTWSAIVVSATDYYPFGMAMPGRSTDRKHRYGFNGKETDPETGIQDYGMRWYLPNIARFPSVDPITAQYPELTPYQFASNTPIMAIDLDGLEQQPATEIREQHIGLTAVRVVANVTIFRTANGNFQFISRATICVDGSPTAYGPNNLGTDFTANAGHNKGDHRKYERDAKGNFVLKDGKKVSIKWQSTNWWAVVTNTGTNSGSPLVKPDGYYISTTAYTYQGQPNNVQERYVNADIVPFAVLQAQVAADLGVERGCMVYIFNTETNQGSWGLFMETRTELNTIGELSIPAARATGVANLDPKGGGQDQGIRYTFYPGTHPESPFRNDAEALDYVRRNGENLDKGQPVDRNPRIPTH